MNPDNLWKPVPPNSPVVDAQLDQMNWLQRATESFCYVLLLIERWISPTGQIREWMRHNARVCAFLFIPALLVMPPVGIVLWQISCWLSMLTGIFGRLIILPILFLLMLIVFRMCTAFIRR